MASPALQTSFSPVPSSCQCSRCVEVINACQLKNPPVSRDLSDSNRATEVNPMDRTPSSARGFGQPNIDIREIVIVKVGQGAGSAGMTKM